MSTIEHHQPIVSQSFKGSTLEASQRHKNFDTTSMRSSAYNASHISKSVSSPLKQSQHQNQNSHSPPPQPGAKQAGDPDYKPEGFIRAIEVKKQIDDVLDNLKGLVTHVVQREEMKIRQHTNPQLNHARLKIVSQQGKVRELHEMETKEHQDLRWLYGDLRSYDMMMDQLRSKISSLDYQKYRERLYSEKLGLINQGKKEDLTQLNKENMQLSYEIDELVDRIASKKKGFFVTNEEFSTLKKDASKASINKKPSSLRMDNKYPLVDMNIV